MSHNHRLPGSFDRTAALARLDGDEELLGEVLEQFILDAPRLLSTIDRAITSGDSHALHEAAHELKGVAGYLGADSLCAAAQQLEGFGRDRQQQAARETWPFVASMADRLLSDLRLAQPADCA